MKIASLWRLIATGLLLLAAGCGGGPAKLPPVNPDPIENPGAPQDPAGDPVGQDPPGTPGVPNVDSPPTGPETNDAPIEAYNQPSTPKLILGGIPDDKVVYRKVNLSALCPDDVGVSRLLLYVDDVLLAETDQNSLTFEWDTSTVEDGERELLWRARDESGYDFRFGRKVVVDNSSDFYGPVVQLVGAQHEGHYQTPVKLRITATDPNKVSDLQVRLSHVITQGERTNVDYAATKGIGTNSASIEINLPQATLPTDYWLSWRAVDAEGNVTEDPRPGTWAHTRFTLVNHVRLEGRIITANGRPIEGVTVSLPGAEWVSPPPHQLTGEQWGASGVSNVWGHFNLGYFKIGGHSLLLQFGQQKHRAAIQLGAPSPFTNHFNDPGIVFAAASPHARLTRQLGFVSSPADRLDLVADKITENWYSGEADRYERLNGADLLTLLDNEASLYGLQRIAVAGGTDLSTVLGNATRLQRLRTWVEDGGVLICTTQAANLVEALYPTKLWLSESSVDGFSAVPETVGAIENGPALTDQILTYDNSEQRYSHWFDWNGVSDFRNQLPSLPKGWCRLHDFNTAEEVKRWMVIVEENPTEQSTQEHALVSFRQGFGVVCYFAVPAYGGPGDFRGTERALTDFMREDRF